MLIVQLGAVFGMSTVVLALLKNLPGLFRAASSRREVATKMITFAWIWFEWKGTELQNHMDYCYSKIPGCGGGRWGRCRWWVRSRGDPDSVMEKLPHKTCVLQCLVGASIPGGIWVVWDGLQGGLGPEHIGWGRKGGCMLIICCFVRWTLADTQNALLLLARAPSTKVPVVLWLASHIWASPSQRKAAGHTVGSWGDGDCEVGTPKRPWDIKKYPVDAKNMLTVMDLLLGEGRAV